MRKREQIEQLITAHMQRTNTPGFAIAIVEQGELSYAQGFGFRHVADEQQRVTPDTLFCIGSVTKTLVATALMRLVDAGKVDLDCFITQYLPFPLPKMARQITLRQLLSHTSGLPTIDISQKEPEQDEVTTFLREKLRSIQLVAPPGKLHYYSNLGYMVAGYIAARIAETPFADLMRAIIFEPLSMTRSTFHPLPLAVSLALPHEINSEGKLIANFALVSNLSGNPAGLAFSTVHDLAQFSRIFLGQPTPLQLSAASLAEMSRPHVALYTPMEYAYGLGLYVLNLKGEPCIMHMGSMMGFMCEFRCFPERQSAVIALSNFCCTPNQWRIVFQICHELLDLPKTFPAPRPIQPNREYWSQYVGSYVSLKDASITVYQENDRLLLGRQGQKDVELRAFKEHIYISVDGKDFVCFLFEGSLPIQYIIINEHPFHRVPELLRST